MTKDDLISRQAAIDAVMETEPYLGTENIVYQRTDDVIANINKLPSVQPEIIRCKDCKHYVVHSFFGRSQGWCERLCDEFDKSLARGTEPDDYCSRAEPYKGEKE